MMPRSLVKRSSFRSAIVQPLKVDISRHEAHYVKGFRRCQAQNQSLTVPRKSSSHKGKVPLDGSIDTGGGDGYDNGTRACWYVVCHTGVIMLKPAIIEELQRLVGPANLLTAPEEKLVYECDGLTMFKATPEVVVFPTSTPQLAEVVHLAHREHIPFVARGGGTGLSGGALAVEGGMMIALTKLNRIQEIDLDNQRAVVEPGVVNLWITQAVAAHGYYYAPDPSSQQACTIG